MKFEMDSQKKQGIIIIEGETSIQNIKSIKNLFEQAMKSTDTIVLDLDNTTYIDLTFLQLLYSAQQKCLESKKQIFFKNTSLEKIKRFVVEAGFSHSIVIKYKQ